MSTDRRDPSIKRMLCRSCDTVLVPGVTCTQRTRRTLPHRCHCMSRSVCLSVIASWYTPSTARREKHVVLRCLTCGSVKRFLTRPNYQLWSTKPENVVSAGSQGQTKTENVGSQGQTMPDNTASASPQKSPTKAGQSVC